MSRLKHLALKVTKTVHKLYDAVVTPGTLTLTGTALPSFACAITVTAEPGHTNCSGTVAVGSETKTFSASGQRMTTTNLLSAIPVVIVAGLDCHILIEAITQGDQTIYDETTSNLPCRIWLKRKNVPKPEGGFTSIRVTEMWVRDFTIVENDIIKFDINNKKDPTNGDRYPVASIGSIEGVGGREKLRVLQF